MIKKLFIVVIFIFASANANANKKLRTIEHIINNDIWSLGKGQHKGKPLLLRFRTAFKKKVEIKHHPKLIKIRWRYKDHPSGMPDSTASDKMGDFENRLVKAVEKDALAVLVVVTTNSGYREWIYYTKSIPQFMKRLTKMPQEKLRYPISLTSNHDPQWNFLYNTVMPGIKK